MPVVKMAPLLLLTSLSAGLLAAAAVGQEPSAAQSSACVVCHLKEEGRLKQVVDQWRGSSHDRQGIGCEGCHGGDPKDNAYKHKSEDFVSRPRMRLVPYFCGKCHASIKEKHLGSPHGAHEVPHCVTCHGSHAIETPDPGKIIVESACTKCHTFDASRKALASLNKARALLQDFESVPDKLQHITGVREHLQQALSQMGLDRKGITTTLHSFRTADIEGIGLNAGRLEKTLERLQERESRRQESIAREQPFILILTGLLVVGTFLGFLAYHGKGTVEPGK